MSESLLYSLIAGVLVLGVINSINIRKNEKEIERAIKQVKIMRDVVSKMLDR